MRRREGAPPPPPSAAGTLPAWAQQQRDVLPLEPEPVPEPEPEPEPEPQPQPELLPSRPSSRLSIGSVDIDMAEADMLSASHKVPRSAHRCLRVNHSVGVLTWRGCASKTPPEKLRHIKLFASEYFAASARRVPNPIVHSVLILAYNPHTTLHTISDSG